MSVLDVVLPSRESCGRLEGPVTLVLQQDTARSRGDDPIMKILVQLTPCKALTKSKTTQYNQGK